MYHIEYVRQNNFECIIFLIEIHDEYEDLFFSAKRLINRPVFRFEATHHVFLCLRPSGLHKYGRNVRHISSGIYVPQKVFDHFYGNQEPDFR